jgi:hypothetical protein
MAYYRLPWEEASFGIALWLAAEDGLITLPGRGSGRPRGVVHGPYKDGSTIRKRRERQRRRECEVDHQKTVPERMEEFLKHLRASGVGSDLLHELCKRALKHDTGDEDAWGA